jgi:hypothetical protein
MLRKALEEKRVKGRAEAIKQALDPVTAESLEEWTKLLLELERAACNAGPGPMTPC